MAAKGAVTSGIEEPLDLIKLSLDEVVFVKMKGERELRGRLHAFDQHMNLVLGDVEETRRVLESPETERIDPAAPLTWKTDVKRRGMLFVRGDAIILVAPPTRPRRT